MVGTDNEKSRIGWVVTMSGDLEEEMLLFPHHCTQERNSCSHPQECEQSRGFYGPQ